MMKIVIVIHLITSLLLLLGCQQIDSNSIVLEKNVLEKTYQNSRKIDEHNAPTVEPDNTIDSDLKVLPNTKIESDTTIVTDKIIQENLGSDVRIIDIFQTNVLALSENGDLWSWGPNHWGFSGNGVVYPVNMPVKIMKNIKTASYHNSDYLTAIIQNGGLWVWGYKNYGQLRDGNNNDRSIPFKLADNVRETFFNYAGIAYVTENGELWVCGLNTTGELGDGHRDPVLTPMKILCNVRTAHIDYGLSYAILNNGELWTWGNNRGFINQGLLGNGSTESSYSPQKILDEVESVSTDTENVFILKTNGELWGYGSNCAYQLLDGTNIPSYSPKKIMDDVEKVYNGVNFETFVLKRNGTLLNLVGNEKSKPPIKILDNVKEFFLFPEDFYYAIKQNGELWTWGKRDFHEEIVYFNKDKNELTKPIKIFDNVKNISRSYIALQNGEKIKTYILAKDGKVWGFGDGPLGNGKKIGSVTPVKIMESIDDFLLNSYYGMTYVKDIQGRIWGFGNDSTMYGSSLFPIEFNFYAESLNNP